MRLSKKNTLDKHAALLRNTHEQGQARFHIKLWHSDYLTGKEQSGFAEGFNGILNRKKGKIRIRNKLLLIGSREWCIMNL